MDSLDGAVGGDVTQRGEHASGTDGQNGGTQVADDELTAGFSHSKVGRGQRCGRACGGGCCGRGRGCGGGG